PYIDPDTGEILGYEATYVGTSAVQRFGDPATLQLTKTTREARVGDRMLPAVKTAPITHFTPHSPASDTEGRIISVHDGVTQIGQFDVVVINRGEADGMEIGHVMKIFQAGKEIKDSVDGRLSDSVILPDEEAGLLMVFRTFDRVSFALVMKATRAIHILDYVRAP
ncbi:MAG: LysM domain-containing protein, partial [Gammaproteobacteria bacterium]|nr:LysM domain-containing protein [Gammaproteobacteria bacterium]